MNYQKSNTSPHKKHLISLLILGTGFFMFASTSFAQDAFSLTVEPSVVGMKIQTEGDSKRQEFTLTNSANSTQRVRLQVFPIQEIDKKTERPIYQSIQELTKVQQSFYETAISFEAAGRKIDEIVLAPKQTRTLELVVTYEENQSLSDYYFSIGFIGNNPVDDQEAKEGEIIAHTRVQGGVGSHVLVSLGEITRSITISDFTTEDIIANMLPELTLILRNPDDNYNRINGKISIYNMFSVEVARYIIEETYILGEQTKRVSVEPHEFETGSEFLRILSFGLNTVSLELHDIENDTVYKRDVRFLSLPLHGMIITTFIIFLSLFLIRRLKKKLS